MDKALRDAITLRTIDALRAITSLERVAELAAMHLSVEDARQVNACIEQIGQEAREASGRIAGRVGQAKAPQEGRQDQCIN